MSSTNVSSSNEMWICYRYLKNKSGYMKFSQKIFSNAIIDIEKQLNSRNIKFNSLIKNFIFSDIQDLFYLIISFFILKIKKKFENQ